MKTINQQLDVLFAMAGRKHPKAGIAVLAMCVALVLPGMATAAKTVQSTTGCVIFPPAYIDTGNPFTLKIVRDPAYPGSWSRPMVDVTAVFTRTDGGKIAASYSETSSRYGYGVTYVYATLLAPSCNGVPCAIDSTVDAIITAVVKEPVNKGKQFRQTSCTPATASVNPSM